MPSYVYVSWGGEYEQREGGGKDGKTGAEGGCLTVYWGWEGWEVGIWIPTKLEMKEAVFVILIVGGMETGKNLVRACA